MRPRFAPAGFNPNDVAFLMVLALPMAWHLGSAAPGARWQWLNRAYLLVAILAILLTGSRSAMLLTPIALSVVPWTMTRLTGRTRVAMVAVLLVAVGVAAKFVAPAALARLETTRTELQDGTLNNRRVIWKAGLHLFPLHPLGGVGAGGFERAVVPFLGSEKTGHNTYLAVLLEQGLVGLALLLLMLLAVGLHVRAAPASERRFFIVLFFTLCVGLTPRTWQAEKQTWIILALLLCTERQSVAESTSREVLRLKHAAAVGLSPGGGR